MSSAALRVILLSFVAVADHRELAGRSGAVLVAAGPAAAHLGGGLRLPQREEKCAQGHQITGEQPKVKSKKLVRWTPPTPVAAPKMRGSRR